MNIITRMKRNVDEQIEMYLSCSISNNFLPKSCISCSHSIYPILALEYRAMSGILSTFAISCIYSNLKGLYIQGQPACNIFMSCINMIMQVSLLHIELFSELWSALWSSAEMWTFHVIWILLLECIHVMDGQSDFMDNPSSKNMSGSVRDDLLLLDKTVHPGKQQWVLCN